MTDKSPMNIDPLHSADAYAQLMDNVLKGLAVTDNTEEGGDGAPGSLTENEIQCLWMAGQLGREGETACHGHVRMVDFGTWNRHGGPDFLRAEIELQGVRIRGDIAFDAEAPDWERLGKGEDPAYGDVALHVVQTPPPEGWFTRNSRHQDIPILTLPALMPGCTSLCKPKAEWEEWRQEALSRLATCNMDQLLQSAAAFRILQKRRLFQRKVECLGLNQAWYEALAETLGYSLNKIPMQMLARRAPLRGLSSHAESILFGTAGFLAPVLPEKTPSEARNHHRIIWDGWWPLRSFYELSESRRLPWRFSPLRPQNHPHRRVAALAAAASRWNDIAPLLTIANARALTRLLTSLSHPYWDTHSSLPSAGTDKRMALIGRERAQDFLINHLYPYDASAPAWATYLSLRTKQLSRTVALAAKKLMGERHGSDKLFSFCYAQQGLLQIFADLHAAGTGMQAGLRLHGFPN